MHVRCVREVARKTLHASPVAFATGRRRRNDSHARPTLISRLARRAQLTKRAALGTFSVSSLRVPFFFASSRVRATCVGSTHSSRICFFPSYFRALLAANAHRSIVSRECLRKRERICKGCVRHLALHARACVRGRRCAMKERGLEKRTTRESNTCLSLLLLLGDAAVLITEICDSSLNAMIKVGWIDTKIEKFSTSRYNGYIFIIYLNDINNVIFFYIKFFNVFIILFYMSYVVKFLAMSDSRCYICNKARQTDTQWYKHTYIYIFKAIIKIHYSCHMYRIESYRLLVTWDLQTSWVDLVKHIEKKG